MTEHPILFRGDMVRAILDARKTMTRRVVNNIPRHHTIQLEVRGGALVAVPYQRGFQQMWQEAKHIKCPYGRPGEKLWVRETHAIVPRTAYARSTGVDQVLRPDSNYEAAVFREGWARCKPGRWRPSIHMPRWASRITLEVIDVRIERLQDISAEDCIAEGISTQLREHDAACDLRDQFRELWNSINARPKPVYERVNGSRVIVRYEAYPWKLEDTLELTGVQGTRWEPTYRNKPLAITPNPCLWCVSFRRVKP